MCVYLEKIEEPDFVLVFTHWVFDDVQNMVVLHVQVNLCF